MLFLENEEHPAKKTLEQRFVGKMKPICQNVAIFEHFQKWPKNQGDVLARGLSNISCPNVSCPCFSFRMMQYKFEKYAETPLRGGIGCCSIISDLKIYYNLMVMIGQWFNKNVNDG